MPRDRPIDNREKSNVSFQRIIDIPERTATVNAPDKTEDNDSIKVALAMPKTRKTNCTRIEIASILDTNTKQATNGLIIVFIFIVKRSQ